MRRLFNEAPLVVALAATNLRGRDQLEAGVGAARAAGGVLAEPLGLGQDLLVPHQAVDSDRPRGQNEGDCHGAKKGPEPRVAARELEAVQPPFAPQGPGSWLWPGMPESRLRQQRAGDERRVRAFTPAINQSA